MKSPPQRARAAQRTGPDELITLFYADEVFDPAHTDTWPEEPVRAGRRNAWPSC